MKHPLKTILAMLATLIAVAFLVIIVNQTLQLADFAGRLHPIAGDIVFWFLFLFYLACLLTPAWLFFRLSPPLHPPESEASPDFDSHVRVLAKRLSRNSRLIGVPLESLDEVKEALAKLDAQSNDLIRQTSSRIFLSTAISQSGSLDALIVLAMQSRLVLDIARTYNQRPSWRELATLYANVMATAFIARELDEADLTEQVQPVLSSVLGSAAGAIPGLQAASTLFVNSVASGAANAFLTLRVGIIAQQYCQALVRPERSKIRRSATLSALGMLGSIVANGATRVSSAIVKASTRGVTGAVTGAVTGVGGKMMNAGNAVADKLPFWKKKPEQADEDD